MRLLEINSCCGCLSTGTIAAAIAKEYIQNGNEATVAYARSYKDTGIPTYKIGSGMDVFCHEVATFLFDKHGLASKRATKKFLKWAEVYDPDILWLHNIHGFYINYELLFEWIKTRPTMQVRWTLHDCWAFTGHCSHFTRVGCYKWKERCEKCPQKGEYPRSLIFDNSKKNYEKKRKSFTGVSKMEIITPSNWLAELVRNSYLKEYPIKVLSHTIDNTVFKPTVSEFRKEHSIENKIIVLGVASTWSKVKGLNQFIELSTMLSDKYAIVLVGVNAKQRKNIPSNILSLPRTQNAQELAQIYSAADVFVNLSIEETFSLTTLESLSCGTPAIVFKGTACEEVATANGGYVVDCSLDSVYEQIRTMFERN